MNFRKVAGDFTQSFTPGAVECCHNVAHYIKVLQQNYLQKFPRGSAPTVFDREKFFLDDCLTYECLSLRTPGTTSVGNGANTISLDVFRTMIGPSKILSYSMFIEPIVKASKAGLKYDQLLELVFAASLLNNPFWFYYTLMDLEKKHLDACEAFKFGTHPFHDWLDATMDTFDGKWQSSIKKRYSPVGGRDEFAIPKLFGCKKFPDNRQTGERLLTEIVGVLLDYTEWIDNFAKLAGCLSDPVVDMKLSWIREKQNLFLQRIGRICKCQFGQFRLANFTTIASGCGLLLPGKHLRHLEIPSPGSVSYKHLSTPSRDLKIEEVFHDRAIRSISHSLGRPFLRDEILTLLVSIPYTISLIRNIVTTYIIFFV